MLKIIIIYDSLCGACEAAPAHCDSVAVVFFSCCLDNTIRQFSNGSVLLLQL